MLSNNKQVTYYLNTRRHFKIWFSAVPDKPISTVNALRLIAFKQNNPSASLTLIYSSNLITADAEKSLQKFCIDHEIHLVDFDTELKFKLEENSLDAKLFANAEMELDTFKHKRGGNLAAASDLVRIISYVIHQYGSYSDLDTNIKTVHNKVEVPPFIKVKSPIIFNLGSKMHTVRNVGSSVSDSYRGERSNHCSADVQADINISGIKSENQEKTVAELKEVFVFNNDMLAKAYSSQDDVISNTAEIMNDEILISLQNAVISNYNDPRDWINNRLNDLVFSELVKQGYLSNDNTLTIPALRHYIEDPQTVVLRDSYTFSNIYACLKLKRSDTVKGLLKDIKQIEENLMILKINSNEGQGLNHTKAKNKKNRKEFQENCSELLDLKYKVCLLMSEYFIKYLIPNNEARKLHERLRQAIENQSKNITELQTHIHNRGMTELRLNMYYVLVVKTGGPFVYRTVLDKYFRYENSNHSGLDTVSAEEYRARCIYDASFFGNELNTIFNSPNSHPFKTPKDKQDNCGMSDLSWTEEGHEDMKKQDQAIEKATMLFQRIFKKRKYKIL